MAISIRFWGVRGSVASPGPHTVGVGGNTPCVEVQAGNTRLVLDAGTGLRSLGNALLPRGRVELTLLLSHLHWDHIQGLPFFAPLYVPGTRIHVVAGSANGPTRETLRRHISPPTFPVDLNEVPASLTWQEVKDREVLQVGEAQVTVAKANHPDAVFAYRVDHAGTSVVYATDTEHYSCLDPRLVGLARGADVLIYDAQYLPEEYAGHKGFSRVGWGHSTWEAGVALAEAAGVGQLFLFHHDPMRTDEGVAAIEGLARQVFPQTTAAREGAEIHLAPRVISLAA